MMRVRPKQNAQKILDRISCINFSFDNFHFSAFFSHIPPLRERQSDIPLLAEHFLAALNKQHGLEKDFSPAAHDFLLRYAFPGNIRESTSKVATGYLLGETSFIDVKDISDGRHSRRNDFDSTGISHVYRQMTEVRRIFVGDNYNKKIIMQKI